MTTNDRDWLDVQDGDVVSLATAQRIIEVLRENVSFRTDLSPRLEIGFFMRGPEDSEEGYDDEEGDDIPDDELILEYTMKNAKGEEFECLLERNTGRQQYFTVELISDFFGIPMDALVWRVWRNE
jgi:hypothetical protein